MVQRANKKGRLNFFDGTPRGTLEAWGLSHVLPSLHGLPWDPKSLPKMLLPDKKVPKSPKPLFVLESACGLFN